MRGRLLLAVALQAVSALAGILPFVALAELAPALLAGHLDDGRAPLLALVGAAALLLRLLGLSCALHMTHLADSDLQLHLRRRLAAHLGRLPWVGTPGAIWRG